MKSSSQIPVASLTRLLRGGASVREAAKQVGYQSEEAFSRTFKRITGQPPVRLRGR